MSVTISGVPIRDLPDLGAVTDSSSVVGEHAGSGRFNAPAFSRYIAGSLSWISVKAYGAAGNGSSDDTSAIQAAYSAVPASGGVVVFPHGTYLISAPIIVGTSETITLGFGSEIVSSNATSDHFQLAAGVNRLVFRDLSLWASVPKSAGAAFKALGVLYESVFYNVQAGSVTNYQEGGGTHRLNNGWDFSLGVSRVYLDPACVAVAAGNGVVAAGTVAGGGELTIDGRILFCNFGCYLGGGIGGVYFNGEISACNTGVYICTVLNPAINREVFFEERCVIDSCRDYSLHIAVGGLAVLDVSGSWFTSASNSLLTGGQGVGLFIEPSAPGPYGTAKISGARFYNNLVTGINNAGMQCLLSGCMFNSNGAGAVIQTTAANGTMIDGCSFLNNTGAGVTIQTGITAYAVTNNMFLNNGSTIGGDAVGWAPTRTIHGNTGYKSRNSGTATMTTGTATVTFAHGLPSAPQGEILISANDQGHTFAVGTVTATNITVNANSNVATNVGIWWMAAMGTTA